MKKLIYLFFLLPFLNFAQEKDTARVLDPHIVLYRKACKLADSSKYKEALVQLKQVQKMQKDYSPAYIKVAYIKVMQKEYKEGIKQLKEVLYREPDNNEALKNLAIAYFLNNDFDNAKKLFTTCDSLKIDDPEMTTYEALLHRKGRDDKGALSILNALLEVHESYAPAYKQRGLLYFQMKNYKDCAKDLVKNIQLLPNDTMDLEKYETLAKACSEIGDERSTIKCYDRVIAIDPKNEMAYTLRGAAKINTNNSSAAIVDLDKAISMNKNSHIAYNFRGAAKTDLKQYAEAMKDLNKAIELKMDYASAYINRALCRYISSNKKNKKEVCADLNAAERLGHDNAYNLIRQYCE